MVSSHADSFGLICPGFSLRVQWRQIEKFIYLFSATYLGLGHGSISLSQVGQTSISPAKLFSSSWGIPRSPTSWTFPENFQRTALISTGSFWHNSKLPPDVWAPYPISKSQLSHPAEETHFVLIFCLILFFWSLSNGRDHRWGFEHRLTGKSKALPSGSASSFPVLVLVQFPHYCGCCTSLLISHCIFLSLTNKTPRYLNSFTWSSKSLPTHRKQSTVFQQRTMASDLEILTDHTNCFTLDSKLPQCMLEVTVWWSQQNHIICKEQRCYSEISKLVSKPGFLLLRSFLTTSESFEVGDMGEASPSFHHLPISPVRINSSPLLSTAWTAEQSESSSQHLVVT